MLYPTKSLLYHAYKHHYGIPAFNFENFDVLEGIFQGAAIAGAPIIVQTTEPAINFLGISEIVFMARALANKYDVVAALHLDHGENVEIVKNCVQTGYGSVMIDYANRTVQENIMMTNTVAQIAQKYEVAVEAEIGYVGCNGGVESFKTDLHMAQEFVDRSLADFLAVSVGNIHGGKEKVNRIDFELLKNLYQSIPVPLVLHGSSGVRNEDVAESVEYGICKINVETELRQVFQITLLNYLNTNPKDIKPRNIMGAVREAVSQAVVSKAKITRAIGKSHLLKGVIS